MQIMLRCSAMQAWGDWGLFHVLLPCTTAHLHVTSMISLCCCWKLTSAKCIVFFWWQFFLYIYQLDCEGHSAGSRIIWSLAAVPTSRASAQLNQEAVVSRQSSPAETRESKNRWNKVLEGKAWQICFCGTLSLHLGAKEGAPQNPRPSFRTLLGPKQSWIGKHTRETSQYPWLVRWHCHATTTRCFEGYSVKHLHVHRCFVVSWDVISIIRFVYCLIWELPLQCEVGFYYIFIHDGTVSGQVWLAGIHQPTVVQEATWQKMSKWPLHLLHRHYTLQLPFAKVETDFEMPGQLANQEVAPKRPSLRIWFWQKSLLAMASSCGSFQDLWFVAAQHLNANILSQDGCGEPEHNLFGSLSFFWSLGRWIRRGAQRFSALKIPGLTSSPWWPWWRLRVI